MKFRYFNLSVLFSQVNIIEENGCMLRISMQILEDVYISKYDRICYRDFGCETFYELFKMLPLANKFVDLTILPPNNLGKKQLKPKPIK